jgi:hypothetical protein
MRNNVLNGFLSLTLMVTATAFGKPADATNLVMDKQTKCTIRVAPGLLVVSPNQTEDRYHRRLRLSVMDMARVLEKMSGADIEITEKEPAGNDARTVIYIGSAARRVFGPVGKSTPDKQGWRIVVSTKGVGLFGESPESDTYAIYELLDRLGCRWYLPGDWGEVIPERKSVAIPAMDISGSPFTSCRTLWYCDEMYKFRNRLRDLEDRVATGQGLEHYISEDQRKSHPNWCAVIDGKRDPVMLCWANPDVPRAIADSIIAQLDKSYRPSVTLSPGDSYRFCECEKCRAMDEGDWDPAMDRVSITDRLIKTCNRIVERVRTKYPDVLFGVLAYVQYTRPPVREKPNDHLIPDFAPISYCRAHAIDTPCCSSRQSIKPLVEGWAKVAKRLSVYQYGYHLAEPTVPYPMITQWSEELPFYFSNHVRYWQPETTWNFESSLPGLYMGIRMAWDPSVSPKMIMDDFYAGFYGPAASSMKSYWETADRAWITCPDHAGCSFGYLKRFPPTILSDLRKALDSALKACPGRSPEYRRVKLVDDSFRQFELFMAMYRNFIDGKFTNLDSDAKRWIRVHQELEQQYKAQYAFTMYGVSYFSTFSLPAYQEAARIDREKKILTVVKQWRVKQDPKKQGDVAGWFRPTHNDREWQNHCPGRDNWSTLGLDTWLGTVWYRTAMDLPDSPQGTKFYLCITTSDGAMQLFVNGKRAIYVGKDKKQSDTFSGYCQPAVFDITGLVEPGKSNHLTVKATRDFFNELGTGGLMGPVVIYQDK